MQEKHSSDDAWNALLRELDRAWPSHRWKNLGVVIGCSGGADSVGLLRAMCEIQTNGPPPSGFIVAAHFNHGLRGKNATKDEESVRELADRLGIQFRSETASPDAGPPPSDEASMRRLRREFFVRTAKRFGARYIATAHTLDDNVETLLHNLMRGTGPVGMAGIPRRVPIGAANDADQVGQDFVLIRPFLSVRRSTIRSALEQINQAWREDESNENTNFRRNWIRHKLIPLIESEYPQATDAMARAIEIQGDWRESIDRLATKWLDDNRLQENPPTLAADSVAETAIVVAALQRLWDQHRWPRREMTMTHWKRLAGTIQNGSPDRYSVPGNVEVIVADGRISLFTR